MFSLVDAVRQGVEALNLKPADQAAVRLALAYAQAVDDGEAAVEKVGPPLLAALESLGMTPRARANMKGVTSDGPVANPLDELLARRAARANRAADMDAAAP